MKFITTVFLLFASIATAEDINGRAAELIDGRSDRTKAAPLVVALHAFLETPRAMKNKTTFDDLARSNGFLVLYPSGERRKWNDGRDPRLRIDDVDYLSTAISRLIESGQVDPNRVFLAGHSNGGGMAMRLACERPELVAGLAVVATKIPTNYQCRDGKPVPAIFFFGTEDPISPPEGRPSSDRLGAALSEEATLQLWANRNGCLGRSLSQSIDRRADGTSVEVYQYSGCQRPLMYVSIIGHGHGWPGAGARFVRLQGRATQEVDASQVAWQFFSQL